MDVRELYQQVILDHNRSPKNFGVMADPTHSAEGFNPLCGDQLKLFLKVDDDGVIEDVRFEGSGCAISKASASLMTQAIKGKTSDEARRLFGRFRDLVAGLSDPAAARRDLGKLVALAGVREFPARVKCASLSWHTLKAALEQHKETVRTE